MLASQCLPLYRPTYYLFQTSLRTYTQSNRVVLTNLDLNLFHSRLSLSLSLSHTHTRRHIHIHTHTLSLSPASPAPSHHQLLLGLSKVHLYQSIPLASTSCDLSTNQSVNRISNHRYTRCSTLSSQGQAADLLESANYWQFLHTLPSCSRRCSNFHVPLSSPQIT